MADSILSSFLARAAFVLTNNKTNITVASGLKIKRVTIKYTSKAQRHVREDGFTFVDTRTIEPVQVEVEAFAPDVDTQESVTAVASDRDATYKLSSRGLVITQVRVESFNMQQSAKMISATPVRLNFRQTMVQYGQATVFAQASDSSLIDRGLSFVNEVQTQASDLATKVTSLF